MAKNDKKENAPHKDTVREDARKIIEGLVARKLTLSTAESCTAGLISGALTAIPGSSEAFYGGFITYSDVAKARMIGVPSRMIRDHGAVSAQVARAMADGAHSTSGTDVALAITGIAGPSGGSDKKPVGLVYFACATDEGTKVVERRFGDIGRDAIREASVAEALKLVLGVLDKGVEG